MAFSDRLFDKLHYKKNLISSNTIKEIEPCLDHNLKCWLVDNEGQIDPLLAMKNLYLASIKNHSNGKANWSFNANVRHIDGATIFVDEKKNKFWFQNEKLDQIDKAIELVKNAEVEKRKEEQKKIEKEEKRKHEIWKINQQKKRKIFTTIVKFYVTSVSILNH